MSEHFGENRVILLQTVAKWRCIKLCAIFLDHPVYHGCNKNCNWH